MRRFDGKVVMVTGAGSGIGRATALRFASEGARVSASDVNAEGLAATMGMLDGAGHHSRVVDVSQAQACRDAVAATVADCGRLDVLCNIAGFAGAYHLHEVTDEFWQRMIAVNLSGVFFMCQAAMPHLLQTKGNIVNMASSAAIVGQVYNAAYCASKGGVNMLTKALAVEFASRGVRVNAVCPGGVNTALTQSFRVPENPDLALFSRLSSLVQPMAEPGEIAGAVAYLASDEARFITGDSLTIDGGQTAS
ncbi:MAG: SDR family oxidoreductase [Pseudomonadales bacterium]|jgi:meso-butanediol dehydrogenase/(S,S)-butanediol dehydrogenase/diacetyl reductase|nr:SDR family oxidoreductase [Pseudomonadales bacterium]MBP7910934.1 SDR family oxidoreductase [Pseudomonadales bacterium]